MAVCCHSLWCPSPIGLRVPLRCHLWVVVGQVITGAACSASIVGASCSICAIVNPCLPPVRLPGLAHAAAPPDLPPTLGSDGDAAQVSISLDVPLLLQVWSPLAGVRAILLLQSACKQAAAAVLWQVDDVTAAPGRCVCLECYFVLAWSCPGWLCGRGSFAASAAWGSDVSCMTWGALLGCAPSRTTGGIQHAVI